MMKAAVLGASMYAVSADMKCPGSKAWLGHAKTQVVATASASCADVHTEIAARASMSNGWTDPHNGGIYSVIFQSDAEVRTQRTTNPKHAVGGQTYTDKQTFTLIETNGKCTIKACSESQGSSLSDFSTNYCDIRNLYCGKADGCTPFASDFTTEETSVDASSGQHDWSACVIKPSPVVV